MSRALTVRDVDAHKFIAAYAEHLKKTGQIELPKWVDMVKTATFKQLPPADQDWYFIRAAAVARKVYMRNGLGIGAMRRMFGGRSKTGRSRRHFDVAIGGVIRHVLHDLEKLGIVEKHPDGGRRVTRKGQKDLDTIARQLH